MGRIKSLMIKKAAKQLVTGTHEFNTDFKHNKKMLLQNPMPSKSTRNKVAGYISRLMVMQKKGPRAKKVKVEEERQFQAY